MLVGDVGLDIERADIYAKELDFLVSTSYGPGRYDRVYEESGLITQSRMYVGLKIAIWPSTFGRSPPGGSDLMAWLGRSTQSSAPMKAIGRYRIQRKGRCLLPCL